MGLLSRRNKIGQEAIAMGIVLDKSGNLIIPPGRYECGFPLHVYVQYRGQHEGEPEIKKLVAKDVEFIIPAAFRGIGYIGEDCFINPRELNELGVDYEITGCMMVCKAFDLTSTSR